LREVLRENREMIRMTDFVIAPQAVKEGASIPPFSEKSD